MDPDADPGAPKTYVSGSATLPQVVKFVVGASSSTIRYQNFYRWPLDPVGESKDAMKFSTWRAAYRSEVIYRKLCEEVDILGDIKNYPHFSWRELWIDNLEYLNI
jgi:hypothetical protein